MKTRVTTMLCVVFVFGLVSTAYAQLIAGSPEDKAFTKIEQEGNLDAKITLLLDYEKQFPQSKVLTAIYTMLGDAYQQKNDTAKVIEIGERAIKYNPEDIDALVTVSYNLGIRQKQQLDKAATYAQKAVDVIAKLKSQPAPAQFSDDGAWKQHLTSQEQLARQILDYVKRVK
jgi:tetratricopeptide (TPR) repeat protein